MMDIKYFDERIGYLLVDIECQFRWNTRTYTEKMDMSPMDVLTYYIEETTANINCRQYNNYNGSIEYILHHNMMKYEAVCEIFEDELDETYSSYIGLTRGD